MSAKNRRQVERGPAPGAPQTRPEAERLIEKGRLKEAVKQAKIGFKGEPTAANRRLLERAYLLRGQQLYRDAMPESAGEVAHHLLDFGVTDPALKADAARFLVSVGLAQAALALSGSDDAPAARDRLIRQAADQAVLHPDRTSTTLPEIRPGAILVREALEALEAGDESRASDLLRSIARGSPFADWRLFARGLAASRRNDLDEARANWDRLDPDRAPARIARRLLDLDVSAPGGVAGVDLGAMEVKVFGEPVLGPLRQLRDHLATDDWDEALRLLSTVRFKLRRIDIALAERLTLILLDPLMKAAMSRTYRDAKQLVKGFTRLAEPLAIDPRWNRLWALIWEGPQGDPDIAEDHWRRYLGDLEHLPALKPDERSLARALVWKRIGESYLLDDEPSELSASPFGHHPPERENDIERTRVVECFEESLRLAPTLRESYQALRDAYHRWEQPERAAEVCRRQLAAFPDDFDALIWLSDHHFRRDEPVLALDAVRRARALRPLDPQAAHGEWAARVALARHFALEGLFDEGRAEFEAAEPLWPEQKATTHLFARKAAFELKAGQGEHAEALIEEAMSQLTEPAPLWLALRIEATRYRLPKPDLDRFEAHWVATLAKKVRSETAGALAELIGAFLSSKIDYPGRDEHVAQVLDYLRKTTRIKYRRDDLTRVCAVLSLFPKEQPLFEKLVRRGQKLFPEAPGFLAMAGFVELRKGPFEGNLRLARKHLEKALTLAEASSHPDDARLVPELREKLSMLVDLTSGPMGLPFGGFGGGPMPPFGELLDMLDGIDDEFDDEDSEEPPTPRARRPKKPKRKKR